MNPLKEGSPPVTAMATPTNSSGNLVDDFEEAFQSCLNVLTKDEAVPTLDKDEIKLEVEQTTLRFIDLARQMEAFFLQKRFLLSALKPELNVKEDISDLRLELARKDELLKRHYEKIAIWQNLLLDLQGYPKSPAQGGSATPGTSSVPQSPCPIPGNQTPNQMMPSIPSAMQQQLQHQQMQLQQQQMHQMQQQQMQQMHQMQVPPGLSGGGVGPGMLSPQQAMFMQQQGLGAQRPGPFPPQGPGGVLQGPLAYLEKTTSNIGITDGRR